MTRNDVEHERYRLARPGPLWTDVTGVLGDPEHAGPTTTDRTEIPLVDELTLAPRSVPAVPITVKPAALANCTEAMPTPPLAPCTSTVSPPRLRCPSS